MEKKKKNKIISLLTTVTENYRRISMHGVRLSVLKKQAKSLGVNLDIVYIPPKASNKIYEQRMQEKLLLYKSQGINTVAFGDIFLIQTRKYRERDLKKIRYASNFSSVGVFFPKTCP